MEKMNIIFVSQPKARRNTLFQLMSDMPPLEHHYCIVRMSTKAQMCTQWRSAQNSSRHP
jgi:hypothetical protein